jgi:hypothetical protein
MALLWAARLAFSGPEILRNALEDSWDGVFAKRLSFLVSTWIESVNNMKEGSTAFDPNSNL